MRLHFFQSAETTPDICIWGYSLFVFTIHLKTTLFSKIILLAVIIKYLLIIMKFADYSVYSRIIYNFARINQTF
jgi:hypothetical protein